MDRRTEHAHRNTMRSRSRFLKSLVLPFRFPGIRPSPARTGPSVIEISDIRSAAERIRGRVHNTPLLSASALGDRAQVRLYLKCENLQKTGSFKPRGALNKVLALSPEERARGLVTVSAGNHAQAVAWAARIAGAASTVVMPTAAPASKIDAT